tara:strand:- start:2022 stop:2282 length:261 start_codon:yes stop_codon:yes gene_type:complete
MGIRLVITLILVVVLYYLGKQVYQLLLGSGKATDKPDAISAGIDLTQDPVCLTYVSKARAISTEHNGETHYFCSEHCATEFENRAA